MRIPYLSALLLAISLPALCQSDSDAVNERIPVSRMELEEHWKVDCRESWDALAASDTINSELPDCGLTGGLLRQVNLCSHIYQAPGTEASDCPDFRAADRLIQQGDCPGLRALAIRQSACDSTPPP